mgnify:CR=1 FL=1
MRGYTNFIWVAPLFTPCTVVRLWDKRSPEKKFYRWNSIEDGGVQSEPESYIVNIYSVYGSSVFFKVRSCITYWTPSFLWKSCLNRTLEWVNYTLPFSKFLLIKNFIAKTFYGDRNGTENKYFAHSCCNETKMTKLS